jgi:hypothetical protein
MAEHLERPERDRYPDEPGPLPPPTKIGTIRGKFDRERPEKCCPIHGLGELKTHLDSLEDDDG